jgi:hypothetical protein
MPKLPKETVLRVVIPVIQVLLGCTFLFSGFTKLLDPFGATQKMTDYLHAFQWEASFAFVRTLAVSQAMFEALLGVWLITGIWKYSTSKILVGFMAIMTPFTLYIALYNPVSDCGCFGEALKLTNWETFIKNGVLIAMAILLMLNSKATFSVYGKRTSWWCTLWSLAFMLAVVVYTNRHLPMIDFTPFKQGNDLNALTRLPETAKTDSFTYVFTYEKDGQTIRFSTDQLPDAKAGWTYKNRSQVLVRKGDEPVINNLAIINANRGDVTDQLLQDTSYVFVFVAPVLEKVHSKRLEKVFNAYRYAGHQGYAFYGLTASDADAIAEWNYEYDPGFEFNSADDRLLKTMIRSNPGLLLLKNGQVVRKWALRDIPDFQLFNKPLQQMVTGQLSKPAYLRVIGLLWLTFAIPFIFIHLMRTGRLERMRHLHLMANQHTKHV